MFKNAQESSARQNEASMARSEIAFGLGNKSIFRIVPGIIFSTIIFLVINHEGRSNEEMRN